MSKVELESFFKSFVLFFGSLNILIAILFFINFTKGVQTLDENILSEMRVCSYDFKCEKFKIDFMNLTDDKKLYTIYKDNNGLTSYYPVPNSQNFLMLFNLNKKDYDTEIKQLKDKAYINFVGVVFVIFILSVLFSVYALYPLRNALLLTQEFIKDILHDFNTPLASLRLNSSMLKMEFGENEKLIRIEQSVQNVLDLQEHLRSYLKNSSLQKEEFELKHLVQERVDIVSKNYPNINFFIDVQIIKLSTNQEALTRILDNILINAAKYNKADGFVKVTSEKNLIKITDSGKGIKNPKKIFNRFYKEQDRGIGIGLHIVKKLCDELKMKIDVESKVDVGSSFYLDISKLTLD